MQIESSFRNETRDYLCPDDGYYNDMATLMFNSHETVIRHLFHHNGSYNNCVFELLGINSGPVYLSIVFYA